MAGPSIYILRLTQNKFYVGKTRNRISETQRLLAHMRGRGAYWTRKYPPQEVMKVYHNCDDFDELKHTLNLMYEHGIDNVRGAEYVSEYLSPDQKRTIMTSIANAKDLCLRCYQKGHFVTRCPEPEPDIYINLFKRKRPQLHNDTFSAPHTTP
jgi:hypothetical protein